MLAQNLDAIQSGAGISLPFSDIGGFISSILPYIFGAAALALLVYLIMGGFQIMTSRGDPKGVQGGQSKITNAIIGFVIVIIAFGIVALIGQLFGIGVFGQIFK
jgi:hypothetical protein